MTQQKLSLLVVEDEAQTRAAYEAYFSLEYNVRTAASVAEARKLPLAEASFAVVDYRLGGEDGIIFTRELVQYLPPARIFLLTADRAPRDLDEDSYIYLSKPMAAEDLEIQLLKSLKIEYKKTPDGIWRRA